MEDDREKIFGAIRKGLREQSRIVAQRNPRSPLLSPMSADFDSKFSRFSSELARVGGETFVSNDLKPLLDSVLNRTHAESNIFVYDEIKEISPTGISSLAESRRVAYSSDLSVGYDKREVAVFDSVIAPCVACIAETGTIVFHTEARLPAALCTRLFVVAPAKSLVATLDEIFQEKFSSFQGSNLFFITGPSRTADIEKELVTGVHGPKEVLVLFYRA